MRRDGARELAGQTLRFAIIGVAATGLYFTSAVALGALGVDPMAANLIAVTVSVAFSYIGHKWFSFRAIGQHRFHLPRFLAMSAALYALSAAITSAAIEFGYSPAVAAAVVCVAYPGLSFVGNRVWVFGQAARRA